MNFRVTLGLVAVLLVLAGAVYFVESKPATPTPATGGKTLLSFLPADVTRLEAVGDGKAVVVVRDEDDRWLLKEPEEAKGDHTRVDGLVSRLGTLAATRTIGAADSLAEFGLDRPKVEARVALRSGQAPTLLVGDQSPDKTAYYAKLSDEPAVYLIPVSVGGDLVRLLADPPKATATPTPLVPIAPAATPSPESTPESTPTPSPPPTPTPTPILPPGTTLLPTVTPAPGR